MSTIGEFCASVGCVMVVYWVIASIPSLQKLAKKVLLNLSGDHKRQTYMTSKTVSPVVTPTTSGDCRSYLYPLPETEVNETSDTLESEIFPPPPLLSCRRPSSPSACPLSI